MQKRTLIWIHHWHKNWQCNDAECRFIYLSIWNWRGNGSHNWGRRGRGFSQEQKDNLCWHATRAFYLFALIIPQSDFVNPGGKKLAEEITADTRIEIVTCKFLWEQHTLASDRGHGLACIGQALALATPLAGHCPIGTHWAGCSRGPVCTGQSTSDIVVLAT